MDLVVGISVSCAIITVLCTIWNVVDKISERKPLVNIVRNQIQVSNPRKKALVIRNIFFSGDAILATGDKRNILGEYLYEPTLNHTSPIDTIIQSSETKRLTWNFILTKENDYHIKLKKLYFFKWDEFNVHVFVKKQKD